MKLKGMLLTGAAMLAMANVADAMEIHPYVGLDYVYSKADYKSDRAGWDKALEDQYNSAAINLGMRPSQYFSLEGFFQQSAEAKGSKMLSEELGVNRLKSEFYAYGLDAYGYMPVGCDGWNLLGTVGLANYNFKIKDAFGSNDKNHMGYRAGLGIQYDMNEHWAMRVVGRYSYIDSKMLDNLMEATAGIRYSF
ncbi:MAG: porin family protein [Alphaproteobacteria bacterium]|nr:porin family protein [Alphaproteobacteria bacterium]